MKNEFLDEDIVPETDLLLFKPKTVILWAIFLVVGIIMDIMHWPFNALVVIASAAGLSAYSITGYVIRSQRSPLNTILSLGAVVWMCVLTYGAFFNGGRPYTELGLGIYCTLLAIFIGFYYYQFTSKIRRAQSNGQG